MKFRKKCAIIKHRRRQDQSLRSADSPSYRWDLHQSFGKRLPFYPSIWHKNKGGNITADRIIIICKECEKNVLVSVLQQFGSTNQIQSMITEDELEVWYEKALRGQSAKLLGDKVLHRLRNEFIAEFPSTTEFHEFFTGRGYDQLSLTDVWRSQIFFDI